MARSKNLLNEVVVDPEVEILARKILRISIKCSLLADAVGTIDDEQQTP